LSGTIDNTVRAALPNLFESSVFCAGHELRTDGPCFGDSGGPLVIFDTNTKRYFEIGVVHGSVGECGSRFIPGIYARLEHPEIINFVLEKMFGVSTGMYRQPSHT